MSDDIKFIEDAIMKKLTEQHANGEISITPEEKYEILLEDAQQMFPYMKTDGRKRMIANTIKADIDSKKTEALIKAEYNIGDIDTLIDNKTSEIVSVTGKVTKSWIDRIAKKDDEGEWVIAKVELTDKTGSTIYTQFYNEKFASLFQKINTDELNGETMTIHDITVSSSKFTVHRTQVQIRKGGQGYPQLSEEKIDVDAPIYEPIPLALAKDGEYGLFLLKVMKDPEFKTKKDGNEWCTLSCKDEEKTWVTVNLWSCQKFTSRFKIKKEDVILVEGRMKFSTGTTKRFLKINVNDIENVTINPKDRAMEMKEKTAVQKDLSNAKIGDFIETVVFFNRIFKKKPYYLACPIKKGERTCNKGVKAVDGVMKCNGDHVLNDDDMANIKRVGMLSGTVAMGGTTMKFSLFDNRGGESLLKTLTGMTVDELHDEKETQGDDRFFMLLNNNIDGKIFKIHANVSEDNYNGTVSLSIEKIEEVDFLEETKRIKERIKTVV